VAIAGIDSLNLFGEGKFCCGGLSQNQIAILCNIKFTEIFADFFWKS
jgi:hypothetical protein